MKIFFRRIHLYLGLLAGIVIMISCVTGAILVFEEELQHAFHKDRYYVTPADNRLPLSQLVANLQQQQKVKISNIKTYNDATRSVEIVFTDPSKKPGGDKQLQAKQADVKKPAGQKPQAGSTEARKTAFIDPYTGKVLEIYSYQDSFFYTVFALHRWLLGGDTGKLITGISTLIFLFIIITGIILWWPKTKKILLHRLKIKTTAGWKRTNHDLHVVLGFYCAIFLFVFAFTALAWSFEWFNDGIYSVTNSSQEMPKPPKSATPETKAISVDNIYQNVHAKVNDAVFYNISLPKDSAGVFSVNLLPQNAPHETASDTYYFDQYTGGFVKAFRFSDRNTGQKIRATFKPVHVSSIFGLPSKIIGCIVCLLGASFPVTGIIMWINRNKKKRRKAVKLDSAYAVES